MDSVDYILVAVKEWCEAGLVNSPDAYGNTALHYAMALNDDVVINILGQYNPTRIIYNNAGQTPMGAMIMGKLLCCMKGEPVPKLMPPVPTDMMALHLAAWLGNVAAGRRILATGAAGVDRKDKYGNTAMHYAQVQKNKEFVAMLTDEFNANPFIPNNANETVPEIIQTGRLSRSPSSRRT